MKNPGRMLLLLYLCTLGTLAWSQTDGSEKGIPVGEYGQEYLTVYTTENGLPSDEAHCVLATQLDAIYVGTATGLARFDGAGWKILPGTEGKRIQALAEVPSAWSRNTLQGLCVVADNTLYTLGEGNLKQVISLPAEFTSFEPIPARARESHTQEALLGTTEGLYVLLHKAGAYRFAPADKLHERMGSNRSMRQVAVAQDGRSAIAADSGLFTSESATGWKALYPHHDQRSWAPRDVRGVAYDREGRLWFASPQGVGVLDDTWQLYTGREGLPYNDFTTVAQGESGVVWFGTTIGAIRYDGQVWEYRQGRRWLPDDDVREIAVTSEGHAWFATAKGVGVIERKPMTLRKKAKHLIEEIDKYHRRTPFGYVLHVSVSEAGNKNSTITKHDSDNDGLWTSMYGASECYNYAITGDPSAKKRATDAFEAIAFLSEVTQGGSHPAPHGFPARSILPTSGHNPNDGRIANDIRTKEERDSLWKIIDPRWPISEDGKWYWKTDTSSDELDGHYFLYALYYDLVAKTDAEKARVQEVVRRITDHIIAHDFQLVDHDGEPTRWARFSPKEMNHDSDWWEERGLNSLSALSYLKTASHITGDSKYDAAYTTLVEDHGYEQNVLAPKAHLGPGTGNQSDDEMAFMGYYNLIKYEKDPYLRQKYALSLRNYWVLEARELCPLFNYIYAAVCDGEVFEDSFGEQRLTARASCLEEALDSLKRYPLDRFQWSLKNSHRLDIVPLPGSRGGRGKGHRVNGKVLPIDERNVRYWNHDPWRLDTTGNGRGLLDGTTYLLPYYMGVYHGFIVEE